MCVCARACVLEGVCACVRVCATRDTCMLSPVQHTCVLFCVCTCVCSRGRANTIELWLNFVRLTFESIKSHVSIHYTNANNNQGITFST